MYVLTQSMISTTEVAPCHPLQTPRDKNNAILAAALIIVVTLTCIMSYLQERSASNVMGRWPARPMVHFQAGW
jgi:hypothetical protein